MSGELEEHLVQCWFANCDVLRGDAGVLECTQDVREVRNSIAYRRAHSSPVVVDLDFALANAPNETCRDRQLVDAVADVLEQFARDEATRQKGAP